jgi:hypothetical protein
MAEIEKFTLSESHTKFAKWGNRKAWELLDKPSRTEEEADLMIEAAHASMYHWRAVGTAIHLQRGKWLLAHVFTILGDAKHALKYANDCLKLTNAHKAELKDFDTAYAYESMARALALNDQMDEARKYHEMAVQAGEQIVDDEDRKIFVNDFNAGDWHGI